MIISNEVCRAVLSLAHHLHKWNRFHHIRVEHHVTCEFAMHIFVIVIVCSKLHREPSNLHHHINPQTSTYITSLIYAESTTRMRRILTALPRTAPLTSSIRPLRTPITTTAPRRSYHEKVLDHYSSPRNVGSMSKTDTSVGTGLVGAPACGDVMKLQIKVNPETDTIEDVKFKTFGCGSAIASSSYLTELVSRCFCLLFLGGERMCVDH